jgi:stage III sporulation protein AD
MQGLGAVLIGVFLSLILGKQNSGAAMLVTVATCVLVGILFLGFFSPVLEFLRKLASVSQLDGNVVSVLFKTVGIGLLAEIGSNICMDAGNASLGKALQLLCARAVLWLSIPLFNILLDMIRQLLGEL